MKKRTIQANAEMQARALVDGNSFNQENRTIEVVFATETPVRRWNWDLGDYMEVLEISEKAIDFSRMEAGAPVLNTHSRYDLDDIIGVVEKAWVDTAKREARALVRFSGRENIQPIIDDIQSGIIRNISVGYSVREYTVENADKPTQQYRATKWTPAEISFVPIPADHNSGTRSEQPNTTNTISILMENNQQEQRQEAAPATPAPAAAPATPAVDVNAVRNDAVAEERTRVSTIMDSCTRAGLTQEFAQTLVDAGTTLDAARAAIIDEVATRQTPPPTNQGAAVTGTDEADQIREAITLGMLHRSNAMPVDISGNERARAYGNMRLLDVAKDRLRSANENITMFSDQEVVKRALATTDFPNLLTGTFNRSLRGFYEGTVPEWRQFARQENVPDFREKTGLKIDGAITFDEIPEGGEYKQASLIEDEAATVKVKKYGRKYSITDIAIINDDLGVFSRLPRLMAIGARLFESKKVWDLIIENATAPDGTAMFHSSHKNLAGSGAVLSEATLSAARLALRKQVTPTGKLPMGLKPKFLIVPPELETQAQKLLSSILANNTNDVNIFANSLQLVVSDALVDPKAWYVAADPRETTVDGLVYSYLSGQEGLKTESRVNFDTDSLEVKGKLFFDATVWGWQGWYKNPGA